MRALGGSGVRVARWLPARVATCVLVVLALAGVALSGSAGAADRTIARDTHIGHVMALDGVVVYPRYSLHGRPLKRPWMRIVNGRLLPARGLQPPVLGASIGLDGNGRVVVPFARTTSFDRWFLYDVVADRVRREVQLPGTEGGCGAMSVWRTQVAFASCEHAYLRSFARTREIPMPPGIAWSVYQGSVQLVLRGSTLVGELADFSDGVDLGLLADGGAFCRRELPGLEGGIDGGPRGGWWLTRHYLAWTRGAWGDTPGSNALFGAPLNGHCRLPGPAGRLFTPPPTMGILGVDDRYVYYGTQTTILRHRLPAQPKAIKSPPNDDFEHATPLRGDAPQRASGVIGAATAQPGDPPITAQDTSFHPSHTVWYAFRPTRTQRVTVSSFSPALSLPQACAVGVYTGPALGALTQVSGAQNGQPMPIDAAAGETYRIMLGTDSLMPDFPPCTLSVM